jgi:hypothetical protein
LVNTYRQVGARRLHEPFLVNFIFYFFADFDATLHSPYRGQISRHKNKEL